MVWEIVEDDILREDGLGGGLRGIGLTVLRWRWMKGINFYILAHLGAGAKSFFQYISKLI